VVIAADPPREAHARGRAITWWTDPLQVGARGLEQPDAARLAV